MAQTVTISELRNMTADDLRREITEQKVLVAKARLGIKMKKEKDTSKLAKARKMLARMETTLSEKNAPPSP